MEVIKYMLGGSTGNFYNIYENSKSNKCHYNAKTEHASTIFLIKTKFQCRLATIFHD